MDFKTANELSYRRQLCEKLLKTYPNRVPIILEKHKKTDLPEIDKKKFLVPKDVTVGQFIYVIRKRVSIPPEQAIYIFINGKLYPTSHTLASVYEDAKDKEDELLYITYSGESTFGAL